MSFYDNNSENYLKKISNPMQYAQDKYRFEIGNPLQAANDKRLAALNNPIAFDNECIEIKRIDNSFFGKVLVVILIGVYLFFVIKLFGVLIVFVHSVGLIL